MENNNNDNKNDNKNKYTDFSIYDFYTNHIGSDPYSNYNKIEDIEESVRYSLLSGNIIDEPYIHPNIYLILKIMIPLTVIFGIVVVLLWYKM